MFAERYANKLKQQQKTGLFRNPHKIKGRDGKYVFIGDQKVLNFSSNDYLGLGASEVLKEIVSKNFAKFGASSSSSRLVSGNYEMIQKAEKAYAEFFGYEDALFFPSGYQANIGIMSTFFEPCDKIIYDKHIHNSSVKGIILSGAEFSGYNHNAMSHLEKRLDKSSQDQVGVITESLFSMDGDFLHVQDFSKLKEKYNFLSIVDEAHAFGALGENGTGMAKEVADIAIGTFGKALGLFGAFVLLPKTLKDYCMNFSSPLIYSTTLPAAHATSALDILTLLVQAEEKREHLRKISGYMKKCLEQEEFNVAGDAHILAIDIGNEKRAAELSRDLFKENIFVFPARYPTVPMGKAILRVSMTTLITEADVEYFVENLIRCSQDRRGSKVQRSEVPG